MGLLDFVKRKAPIEKLRKELCEPYSQPEYRRTAMEKLVQLGTEDAFDALLRRYTFAASGQIADEEEKSELLEELVRIGQPAVGAIKKFIKTEKQVVFPIKALAQIVPREELLSFLIESLSGYDPMDHRSTQAKTTLVMEIAEFGGPEHAQALAPYLKDHHDDVQFQVIAALEKFKHLDTRPALLALCCGSDHSARIQRRAAQALADLEWVVKEHYERMSPEVQGDYTLGKKGNLVARSSSGQGERGRAT